MNDIFRKQAAWIVAILVVIAAGVIWLVAASGPNVPINKDVQSKCQAEVSDKTFCKFAGAFAASGDYSMVMTQKSESGTTVAHISIANNGNSSMSVDENGTTMATIAVYNGNTYVKDPTDNQWIQYASASTNKPEVTNIRKSLVEADFKNDKGQKESYVNKGTEFVNGYTCYKYQVIDPAKPGANDFIWFDKDHLLLRKLSSTDSTGSIVMTVTYATVNIAQPSPVKATTQ